MFGNDCENTNQEVNVMNLSTWADMEISLFPFSQFSAADILKTAL